MESAKVTVSNRGYIVLSASLRKEMEIKPGTEMLLKRDKDKIILETVPSFTKKLAGLTAKTIAKTPEDVNAYNQLNLVQIFAFAICPGRFCLYLNPVRIFRLIRIMHQNRPDQYRNKIVRSI